MHNFFQFNKYYLNAISFSFSNNFSKIALLLFLDLSKSIIRPLRCQTGIAQERPPRLKAVALGVAAAFLDVAVAPSLLACL